MKLYKEDFQIIIACLIIAGALFLAGYGLYKVNKAYLEYERKIDGYIGTEVVLANDTLVVVSFSSWSGRYILSNGAQVDPEIIIDNSKDIQLP